MLSIHITLKKMTEISQFKVDLNHPILVHPFYKTYYAVELSTNHKFRADYIKKKN